MKTPRVLWGARHALLSLPAPRLPSPPVSCCPSDKRVHLCPPVCTHPQLLRQEIAKLHEGGGGVGGGGGGGGVTADDVVVLAPEEGGLDPPRMHCPCMHRPCMHRPGMHRPGGGGGTTHTPGPGTPATVLATLAYTLVHTGPHPGVYLAMLALLKEGDTVLAAYPGCGGGNCYSFVVLFLDFCFGILCKGGLG